MKIAAYTQQARSYKYMIGGVNYPQTDIKINPTANKAQILLDSLRQEISVYDQRAIEVS